MHHKNEQDHGRNEVFTQVAEQRLGLTLPDGKHSACNSVATWVAGGCTVAPPIVALCLRAG